MKQDKRDLTASWATTVFNIGLLLRDMELYDAAWIFVCWANKVRWQTVDPCNKDYCSSLNVQAEIEIMLHKKEMAYKLVKVIESKENLPEGFSKLFGHSWYVCSLYYFEMEDYLTAYKYVNKSLSELENDIKDVKQILLSKMLLGSILQKAPELTKKDYYPDPEQIYKEVLTEINHLYGEDSYFSLKPCRFLMKYASGWLPGRQRGYHRRSCSIFSCFSEHFYVYF